MPVRPIDFGILEFIDATRRIRGLPGRIRERLQSTAAVAREHPGQAAARTGGWLGRWILRVTLPMAGAAAMLHLFPYHAVAGGVHFRVEGTLLTRSGLSANTTFGNWEFPHVDGLPIGAHISPENIDVVQLASKATQHGSSYVDSLRADLSDQVPWIVTWLAGEALLGALLGLGAAAAINLALRYLRGLPRRAGELRLRLSQFAAAVAVFGLVAGYGAVTFNAHWVRESRITGTLAALQLFPNDLSRYYTQQSKVFDVISAIAGIQAQLQDRVEQSDIEPAAFNIMFISDMHLASTYPLVRQYAENFDVSLIINTGDESEFGTRAEMTTTYLNQLRALTKRIPMIWLAGNHDSADTVEVMQSIPGVTVLGRKVRTSEGEFEVSAEEMNAFGLRIAAVPDPRVYGGGDEHGSNEGDVVHALEESTVDAAVKGVPDSEEFDIFATHEPVAAQRLVHDLPDQIRQTNAGHLHEQNPAGDIEHGNRIQLVEGSTGAGGLDNINRGVPAPPIEFSIESVSATCQFTKVVRFQLVGPPPDEGEVPTTGQQVTASTRYLDPQQLDKDRQCGVYQQLGAPSPLPG